MGPCDGVGVKLVSTVGRSVGTQERTQLFMIALQTEFAAPFNLAAAEISKLEVKSEGGLSVCSTPTQNAESLKAFSAQSLEAVGLNRRT